MKKIFSTIRFYFKSFYALPEIKDNNDKISFKSIAKLLGILFLVLYVLASFGFLAWEVYYSMYSLFASVGIQKLLIMYALLYGAVAITILCVLTAISTIYSNDMEIYITTLPLRTSYILSAKASTIAFAQFGLALLIIGSGLGIYWYFEHSSVMFLINAVLLILIITVVATALGYIIGLPLLSISKFFRNRDMVMILVGLIAIGFMLFFNATTNRIMAMASSPEALMKLLEGSNQGFLQLYNKNPVFQFILATLLEPQKPIYVIALTALLIAILGLVYLIFELMAPLYRYVVRNFSENYIKKLDKKQAKILLGKETQQNPKIVSLVLREIRLMNREPVYFLNGPFIIILMPLILGISFYFNLSNNKSSAQEITELVSSITPIIRVVLVSLIGAFLGSATSITCTSISRDAKQLSFMKSLPISGKAYLAAKLIHGCIFGFLGIAMSVLLGVFLFKMRVSELLLAMVIGFSIAVMLNIAGLIVDTINPRLKWETPVAAMKQNINAVIVILAEMVILGVVGYFSITYIKTITELFVFTAIIPIFLSVVMLIVFMPFAEKRLKKLDV
ncbi:MAG TPA: hypothetical protein PK074_00640 [Spirochaetales bacterium]|nr:hypothetical protein [Spirochaetales bacterium]HOT58129.1 hypothetical protein [Spirochaetales bacterium]HPD80815.1 hypothetical protein [Spirochaetales bacterium]HQK33208.1 hypothetical protein [Spirochaetales bacterium]HRV28287.1 hypothetical protein [Spirochaetia bacterium]